MCVKLKFNSEGSALLNQGIILRFILIVLYLACFFIHPCFSSENVSYLKDGKIVIETATGIKTLDYSKTNKYSPYNLKKWDVKEEINVASEALDVYEAKGDVQYKKKVWIINRSDDTESIFVEYWASSGSDRIIFSQDEEMAYYIGITEDGLSVIFGIDLSSGAQYEITQASSFDIVNCDNTISYIMTQRGDQSTVRYIYNLSGELDTTLRGALTSADIQKLVCY